MAAIYMYWISHLFQIPIGKGVHNIQAVIYWFFLAPPPIFSIPIGEGAHSIPIGEGAQYIMADIYWMIPSYFQFPLKRGLKYFGCDVLNEPYFDFPCYWRWDSKYCGRYILNPPLQTTDSKNLFFHPYTMKKIPKIYN